jgi:hypothetical protein
VPTGSDLATIAELTYNPATRYFGFRVRKPGHRVHFQMEVFPTLEDARAWIDPHHERVWEEPSDADEDVLEVSRDFKERCVAWRFAHLTLAELQRQRLEPPG